MAKAESDAPIRFAVIGCGMLARSTHIPNLAQMSQATLQLCCDLDENNLAECRDRYGVKRLTRDYRQAVEDDEVDAICLATTEQLRLPVIALAAELGKPVYVEKPLARTLDEIYRIRDVVVDSGIPFCIGHNRRASPAMREAHRIFREHMRAPKPCPWRFDREGDQRPKREADGVPGMSVRINDDWHSWKKWVFDPQHAPHGPMLFEMTHFTDICNWFLDDEPEEVVALEHDMFNHGVVIRYAGGAIATITMCSNGTFGYPKELYEVMGMGAMVVVDHMVEVRTAGIADVSGHIPFALASDAFPHVGQDGGLMGYLDKVRAACAIAAEKQDPTLQFSVAPDKGHAHAMRLFVDEIRGHGATLCGIHDAVKATEVAFCGDPCRERASECETRRSACICLASAGIICKMYGHTVL